MAIKRYVADKDNTITNAYKANLSTRGVSGNMGQSDIVEVFHIYGQAFSSSSEDCRVLIQFPISTIATDRTDGDLPASGSVSFFLKMYNVRHSQTTPKDFTLIVLPVSSSWQEGLGLDMEEYSDIDASNWITSSGETNWTSQGGDYLDDSSSSFSQFFDTGFENLEVDITPLVEQWIDSDGNVLGSKDNYGVGIALTGSDETAAISYYTKKFFGRAADQFFKRPIIEARWDDSKKDNRGNFYLSSSLMPASDNLMKLYMYNVVFGQLQNIPAVGTGSLEVSIYSGSTAPTGSKLYSPAGGGVVTLGDINITASYVETGIYSCSFAYVSSSITKIFDVWHSHSNSTTTEYHTGSAITVTTYDSSNYNPNQQYFSNVTNLRSIYSPDEKVRFRLYARKKNWSPNIYTVASQEISTSIINDVRYKMVRLSDNLDVVPYGTGTIDQTRLSYDVSGSYFDFDMSMLETDNTYQLKFAYKINGSYVEQPEDFRFRVE